MQGEQEEQQYHEAMHQDNYKIKDDIQETLDYLASSDPDTMYFDQAMKQPHRKEFMNAEIIEFNSHFQLKHWKILLREEVPKGQSILDSVWAMKRNGTSLQGKSTSGRRY